MGSETGEVSGRGADAGGSIVRPPVRRMLEPG